MNRWPRLVGPLLLLLNLPLLFLWWRYSGPDMPRAWSVPALFLLLTLAIVGMVILPLCLGRLPRKRWLLVLVLSAINLYWSLRWIEAFAQSAPGQAPYIAARQAILWVMAASTLAVLLLYALVDRLLTARERPSQNPSHRV